MSCWIGFRSRVYQLRATQCRFATILHISFDQYFTSFPRREMLDERLEFTVFGKDHHQV